MNYKDFAVMIMGFQAYVSYLHLQQQQQQQQ